MRRLKALSESRAVYADASHYRVSIAGLQRGGGAETSYLCQYDSALCDRQHSSPGLAGLYRYTHICSAGAPAAGAPASPAVQVYAPASNDGDAAAGCDQLLLHPGWWWWWWWRRRRSGAVSSRWRGDFGNTIQCWLLHDIVRNSRPDVVRGWQSPQWRQITKGGG